MSVIRYTQTAVASFGASKQTECASKPAGYTRLTPALLNWVKTVAGIEGINDTASYLPGMYHEGISDPGERNEFTSTGTLLK